MTIAKQVAKPWGLMRHHAGWADIFLIESETDTTVTGHYPSRESDEQTTYNAYGVLARFETQDEARAARERGLEARRAHDSAVDSAAAALKAAEKARDDAWLAGLRG